MINKQSIYYWFFFPLLALLSAGSLTSCIYDSVLEETDMSGKSTLSITMRGITTTDPGSTGSYDDYVKTLRVIGYDGSGNVVCNDKYAGEQLGDVKTDDKGETYIEITQLLENFSGGSSNFYFIANEEEYYIYNENETTNQTSLSSYLENDQLTEEQLKEYIIASTPDDQDWSEKPILMIANPSAQYIKPGENNSIADVKLVRCVAKVQLIVQKEDAGENKIPEGDEVTISDVSLHGTRPDSYSLWDTKSHFATKSDKYTHDFTITNDKVGYGTEDSPAYTSDIVYFPETLFSDNTTKEVLYFTFTLTYTPDDGDNATEKTYIVAIGDDANDDGVVEDYNIYRNTIYTVTATLQPTTNPEMNIEVTPWTEVEVDVPPFE